MNYVKYSVEGIVADKVRVGSFKGKDGDTITEYKITLEHGDDKQYYPVFYLYGQEDAQKIFDALKIGKSVSFSYKTSTKVKKYRSGKEYSFKKKTIVY